MGSEADVVAKIDALERDYIDEVVNWQLADSPAAHTEHPRPRLGQAHMMFTVAGTSDPMHMASRRIENILRMLDEVAPAGTPPLTIPVTAP